MRRLLLVPLWLIALIPRAMRRVVEAIRGFLREVGELFGRIRTSGRRRRARWFWRIGKPLRSEEARLPQPELERLMRRSRDLRDLEDLTRFASTLRVPEQEFVVTRDQIREALRRILEAQPPFLYLGRAIPEPARSDVAAPRVERIRKRERVHVHELIELLVPEERPVFHRSDAPPGDQALRPARSMRELPRALLLDRVLPPRLQVERFSRGDLMVIDYVREEPRIEFIPRQRLLDFEEERDLEVEVALEAVDPDESVQLVYFLIDTSASMRGASAILAATAFCAIHRANMAVPATYFMRTFSDHLSPGWDQPPWEARTLADREALFERVFTLNFNGSSTHTEWALEIACRDIAAARERDPALARAAIILITDGRCDLLPDTIAQVIRSGAPLHTLMVSRERNQELERISESFTFLSGLPESWEVRADLPSSPEPARPVLRP